MNVGLLTSYVIGGMILLAILTMNISVSNSSVEITLTQVTREKAQNVSELFSHDLQKMGYNRTAITNPILKIGNSHKIQFYSNIDNSTDNSAEIITWELTTTEVTSTGNPNDFVLMRSVEDPATGTVEQTPIKLGVTNFNLSYFKRYGAPLSDSLSTPVSSSDLNDVKQLYVRIGLESGEKVYYNAGSDGRFIRSVWEKRFSPPNLGF